MDMEFRLQLRHWIPDESMPWSNPFRIVLLLLRGMCGWIPVRLTIGTRRSRRLTRGAVESRKEHNKCFPERSPAHNEVDHLIPKIFDHRALRIEKSSEGKFVYYLIYEKDNEGIYARRVVDLYNKRAYHDVLFSDVSDDEGVSISKETMKSAVYVYQRLSINKIELMAGLSHGGFLWPKFGFCPLDEEEWRKCKYTIRTNFARLERNVNRLVISLQGTKLSLLRFSVLKLLDSPDPTAIWTVSNLKGKVVKGVELSETKIFNVGDVLLEGSRWKGVLNFTDNDAKKILDYRLR